jgi:hypothetical protein
VSKDEYYTNEWYDLKETNRVAPAIIPQVKDAMKEQMKRKPAAADLCTVGTLAERRSRRRSTT